MKLQAPPLNQPTQIKTMLTINRSKAIEKGSARCWRAVFGGAPNTFVRHHPVPCLAAEKFVSGSCRRDGDDCTRDAGVPQQTESFRRRAVFIALACVVALLLTSALKAQTFMTLYSFTAISPPPCPCPNSDGAYPNAGLILFGNILYGTAALGGDSGYGTVFALDTDGTGLSILYSFTGGSDGALPIAGVILSSNTLYGTTEGIHYTSDNGAVFKVNTDGTGFATVHCFTSTSGSGGSYAALA